MRNITRTLVAFAFVALTAGTAAAGGQAGSLGAGAEFDLGGVGGVSLNYDGGIFHAGGAVGYADAPGDENTLINIAGRFYYHLHSTASSDFGVGGGLGLQFANPPGPDNDTTAMFIQIGMQIRAFISTNVALSASGGLVVGAADAEGLALTGETFGSFGIHYYFF